MYAKDYIQQHKNDKWFSVWNLNYHKFDVSNRFRSFKDHLDYRCSNRKCLNSEINSIPDAYWISLWKLYCIIYQENIEPIYVENP